MLERQFSRLVTLSMLGGNEVEREAKCDDDDDDEAAGAVSVVICLK